MKDWLRQHLGVFLSGLALLAVTQLWVSLALETPWPDAAARTLVNALFGAGIIAYIRHPGSWPGTLGDLWAGGTASCHRGQLIFQEAMSRTDIELGSPTKFDVVAATDVPRQATTDKTNPLPSSLVVQTLILSEGTVEIAAEPAALARIEQEIFSKPPTALPSPVDSVGCLQPPPHGRGVGA